LLSGQSNTGFSLASLPTSSIGPRVYKMNPYYFAAVIIAESGGNHMVNGKLHSSGQAGGIGQIAYSWVGRNSRGATIIASP
jgi:hypothetical protein